MFSLEQYRQRYQFEGNEKDALHFVGDNSDIEKINQFQFLIDVGLKPHHKFLDLACGCLRGTIDVIDYLDSDNFYGVDISEGLIYQAFKRCHAHGVKNTPNLFINSDFAFDVLLKCKFDFILSVSLLTHLLPHNIPEFFYGVSQILNSDGVFYFTMYPVEDKDKFFEGDIEVARYNKDFLKQVAKEYGLIIEDIEGDYPNPVESNIYLKRVNVKNMGQWVMKARLKKWGDR